MLYAQAQLLAREEALLSPFAQRSRLTKGRKFPEPEDPFRLPFQRDRDRIVHSKAFRRLAGKTQVFTASYGDHYRSRLTHSMEVAITARDIARALGLNEDLTEAIALAHDLGHTPFGHAGEEAMHEVMQKFGVSFEHNEQSLRIVTILEKRSPDFPGLNLTVETLQGLMKHRNVPHSPEAQVADIADRIAYHHHDLDDGLRSGILEEKSLKRHVMLWQTVTEDLSKKELSDELYWKIAITRLMSLLIDDLLLNSEKNVTRGMSRRSLISFSPIMQGKADQLAEYLGKAFYVSKKVTAFSRKGQDVIRFLFQWYSEHDRFLPGLVRSELNHEKRYVVIKDYIAGMTDAYALAKYEEYKVKEKQDFLLAKRGE